MGNTMVEQATQLKSNSEPRIEPGSLPAPTFSNGSFSVCGSFNGEDFMLWEEKQKRDCGAWILQSLGMKEVKESHISALCMGMIVLIVILTLLGGCGTARAEAFTTEASYYTYASCIREGTSGIMANGKVLNDEAFTCASWDYKFGTRLLVTNKRNGRQVVLQVTDRGPSKRLYKRGRRIDLSLAAAQYLGFVKEGLATVSVSLVGG